MPRLSVTSAATAALCLLGFGASAATISVVPNPDPVAPSDAFSADVVVSDVGGLTLLAWDATVTYDATLLSFVNAAYGNGLTDSGETLAGPIQNEPVAGTVLISGSTLGGAVAPAEGSTLFILNFNTRADALAGPANISIDIDVDEGAVQLMGGGTVTVVPAPAAAWLFGSALIGLLGAFRRSRLV